MVKAGQAQCLMGYLFNSLKDDCCGADGKGAERHSVRDTLDQPQREVQVVCTLDDRSILERTYIVAHKTYYNVKQFDFEMEVRKTIETHLCVA